MPNPTYPGVYIEERPGGPAPVQGVSTSTLALIGFTEEGPTDLPVLVTGMTDFREVFGDFTADALSPTMMHAFFRNGGQQAYMVRVVGAGAARAKGYLADDYDSEDSGIDGTGMALGAQTFTIPNTPVVPYSFSLDYETVVTAESVGTGDGTKVLFAGTLADAPTADSTVVFSWQEAITGESVGAGDGMATSFMATLANIPLAATTPITVTWTSGSAAKSATLSTDGMNTWTGDGNSGTINPTTGALTLDLTGDVPDNMTNVTVAYRHALTGTYTAMGTWTGDGTSGTVNRSTGAFSINLTGDIPAAASAVTATYTTTKTITDNGSGALTGDVAMGGTIDYATGEVAFTFSPDAVRSGYSVLYSYSHVLWEVEMAWPGAKGDDHRVLVFGTPGFEADDDASFTAWTLVVQRRQADGTWVTRETFDELDFYDSTSPNFVTSIINAQTGGSSLITIIDVGNDGVPATLFGRAVTAESLGTGDGSTAAYSGTLADVSSEGVHPGTVRITATSVGAADMVVTDDGNGNLVGSVAGSGTNTIDYETGDYDFTFAANVANTGVVSADYFAAPTASQDAPVAEVLQDGSDGAAVTSSQVTAASLETDFRGLYALNRVDDLLLVAVPDFAGDEDVDNAIIDYCEQRKDRFAILTVPPNATVQEAVNYKRLELNRSTSYAAVYAPWVTIQDPVTDRPLDVPPMGHVAGVYARTDSSKNVGKAPAGVEDGRLRFALGLAQSFTPAEAGVLYQQRINPLVRWSQLGGNTVWGARTLETGGEFGYIQARRLFQFVEKSVFNATHVYVFENNGSELWARIRLQLGAFLLRLYSQGYFAGSTPEDSFFVVVDATNNPPANVAAGLLTVDIGIAPNKPAEFIVFRFQQFTNT